MCALVLSMQIQIRLSRTDIFLANEMVRWEMTSGVTGEYMCMINLYHELNSTALARARKNVY